MKRYKLTDTQIAELRALAAFFAMPQIAKYFAISTRTFERIKAGQPEAQEAWEQGKTKAHAFVGGKLMELIKSGDRASIMFYLKCQCGWRETTHIDLQSSDGSLSPHKPESPRIDLSKVSDAALEELANAAGLPVLD